MRAALIADHGATVENVVEYDPEAEYDPVEGYTLDTLPDGSPVGPGWRWDAERGYSSPPMRHLWCDRRELIADGADTVTVVYTDTHDDAPASVVFDVNGEPVEVQLTAAGNAHLDVAADEPGEIVVAVGGLSLVLTATAPEG